MHIGMITPAKARALCGNRATATRWAGFLRRQGHQVSISTGYDDSGYDLLLALHAWRSADAIQRFASLYPGRPLLVALTGTDLYRFIHSQPEATLRSIELADRLIVLHETAHLAIPAEYRGKVNVVYQSAMPLQRRLPHARRSFDFCVVGHLRDEKDSLRPAYAVRDLPASSRIRISQYGKAYDRAWARKAKQDMQRNRRYRWLGERPHWQVRQAYARSRAMLLPSLMEGGANVISEAVTAALPVIASDIPGSVGLLGKDYAGYYPVGDTAALRDILLRAESDPGYLPGLAEQAAPLASRFTPAAESAALAAVLQSLH